jgi:hypothetical protein
MTPIVAFQTFVTSHIVKRFIIKEKAHDVDWVIPAACTTKEKG